MTIKKFLILFISLIFIFSCTNGKTAGTPESHDQIKNNLYVPAEYKGLSELQSDLRDISKKQTPSVVFISTEKTITQTSLRDPFDFFFGNPFQMNPDDNKLKERKFKQSALGSGVIYDKKGDAYYILTNNHVIEDADSIKITVSENKSYTGKLVGSDPNVDIAVVKINTKDDLVLSKIGDSSQVSVGDFAVAVGNPFGLNGTMTFGIISAVGRSNIQSDKVTLTDFIQTDASINPGNSGGPLLNINGEVIGINTLIYSQSGGSVGIGFAVPINVAKRAADQIIKKGRVDHGYLGIYYKALTEDDTAKLGLKDIKVGMLVNQVIENSPAEKSGIKVGDVLIELNGKKLINSNDLAIQIGNLAPGTKIEFKILRDDKLITKEVVLGTRNEKELVKESKSKSENSDKYDMEITELSQNVRAQYNIPADMNGVLVASTTAGGKASLAGIITGDVIFKINNKSVKNISDFNSLVKNNELNYFFIYRDGKTIILTM